jgi:hypothetical protein
MDPEAWNCLRRFMEEMGFGRLFGARPGNFAWLLGGENTYRLQVGEEVLEYACVL